MSSLFETSLFKIAVKVKSIIAIIINLTKLTNDHVTSISIVQHSTVTNICERIVEHIAVISINKCERDSSKSSLANNKSENLIEQKFFCHYPSL